ncbi:hypothetical protein BD779DRAFT_1397448, partial [Infundibulicybe gibba]
DEGVETGKATKSAQKKRRTTNVDSSDVEDVDVDSKGLEEQFEDVEVDDEEEEEVQDNEDDSDLDEAYCSHAPTLLAIKTDTSRDVWLMFERKSTVRFNNPSGTRVVHVGSWCKMCKGDPEFVERFGLRKCFHLGGNSSLRGHIRSKHWVSYKNLCEENGISPNKKCMPTKVAKALADEATEKEK